MIIDACATLTNFSVTKHSHFHTDCRDGDILLYDGYTLSSDHSNGTVIVCLNNVYGTVCDDFWNPLDATVVCTQLGFTPNGKLYLALCAGL